MTQASTTSKVWFITGASRGFGALIARDALLRGDRVIATARNPQTVIDALGEQANLLALKLDVTSEADAQAAAKQAVARFGRIDVLVNNAGYGLLGGVEEASAEEVKRQFDTNVFGLLHVTRAVLPTLRAQGSGHVINISSIGGYASHQGWGIYCATKFAVEALTEALHTELAPLGVRATVVEPGFFRTDFLNADSVVSTSNRIAQYADSVGVMRTLMAGANHKQPGDPAKLATAILKLADDANPPLRLALGSDTIAAIRNKNQTVEAELQQWLAVSTSTNHDDVTA
ncbi:MULTISPECIES: oxidoreductase [unclassified Herbaspirillum]|uniref:oxidoreductase n=1 Tax=unclassified Herbaspirillum TaxID=2624150 RepID=UPI000E2E798F|nr:MULTISPECIES: oxidoreductase [unclassified Herbaspirillum]RFB67332.1 SDR family NAD(P)-dependent oxidoreductase [Herbaspirillum sp. 3R-3a1]TFI04942.1 SDR family NAD(P)-dependent oxidoreductase [Herbaspirillum sp. 3R11]TFI12729.1 SDR family NAD(P)-dependent oxidoreductase [Herbaspirillum sp. 3R-11]TFI22569.1 SDR family NAD(P)-dependent oxidoreductase [Herbaspirillum sp. 3C11]